MMTCFTTRHIQRGGGGVRATFFNSEGAKINDSLGPPGIGPPRYAPAAYQYQYQLGNILLGMISHTVSTVYGF